MNGHGHSHEGHNHGHNHGHTHSGPRHTASVPIRESMPFSRFFFEFRQVLRHPQSSRISLLFGMTFSSVILVTFGCSSTNSLALSTFNYLTWFHILNLLTCYLTLWTQIQSQRSNPKKRSPSTTSTSAFYLGYGRFEVLAVFSATVVSQLAGLFVLKESVERLLETPAVHTGRLMLGAVVCFFSQLLSNYLAPSTALGHVIEVSQSSWLQEHTADMAHSLCSVLPFLSSYLLPRINPMSLLSFVGLALMFITNIVIEINDTHSVDCLVSMLMALLLLGTMHPFTMYTGRILLQTTPPHIVPQLERYLRESLTIDGVLEFKDEHFWTVSFGKLAGSLTVRIRRDADEQLVLAHLTNKLSNLVWPLTIQIIKDDHFITKMHQSNLNYLSKVDGRNSFKKFGNSINSPGMSPVNGAHHSATDYQINKTFFNNSPSDKLMSSEQSRLQQLNQSDNNSTILTSTPKSE